MAKIIGGGIDGLVNPRGFINVDEFQRNPASPNVYAVGVCVAIPFVALPQIPPRNTNWAARGKWVHVAKIGFEKYFLRKVRNGQTEPAYERLMLKLMGVNKLKAEA